MSELFPLFRLLLEAGEDIVRVEKDLVSRRADRQRNDRRKLRENVWSKDISWIGHVGELPSVENNVIDQVSELAGCSNQTKSH